MKILRRLWLGLCWGTLLIVVLAAVGSLIVFARINTEIRYHVLAELEKRYPNLDIQIGSVRLDQGKGITIHDIDVAVPQEQSIGHAVSARKLLHIKELFAECNITLQALYQKNLAVNRLVLKSPILRATRSQAGSFDEINLLLGSGIITPVSLTFPIEVENGTLLYDDLRTTTKIPLKVSGIALNVWQPGTKGTPAVTGCHTFTGSAQGDLFRQLAFEGTINPETKQWELTAHCRQLDWSDDLVQYISVANNAANNPASNPAKKLSFQGRFNFDLTAKSEPASELGFRFAAAGSLTQGRIELLELDRILSEVSARFEITDDKIEIDKCTGIGDSAHFVVSYCQEGLKQRRSADLVANLRGLYFDERLVDAISPFLNKSTIQLMSRYDYAGTTDLHAQLQYRNGKWKPANVSLQVADVAFSYHDLPYKVDQLCGNLYIDETESLHFQFVSKPNSPLKVKIDGHYQNVLVDAAGKVEIIGEGVPIDKKLMDALPESVREVGYTLNPTGKLNTHLVIVLPPGDHPLQKIFNIGLDHVTVSYNRFPYPLHDVTGLLQYRDDVWTFDHVLGINGTAAIKCKGHLKPIPSPSGRTQEFFLNVLGEELPIDEQIANALLDPDQKHLLQSLNVKGKVNLTAQIQYNNEEKRLNLCFQATPRPGLSLCPDRFPYRVENVQGEIRYDNGNIRAEHLTASNRETKLQSGLECRFEPNGSWVLRLAPLSIDQLQHNRELLDALPKNLQGFMESIQLTKPINISGGIELSQKAQFAEPLATANSVADATWDLNMVLHQNTAKFGFPVENMFGKIRLTGLSTKDTFQLSGNLNLDSITLYGYQTTSVQGPFYFDGRHIQLGQPADKTKPNIPAKPLTGKFFDGTWYAEGLVFLENGISYSINTALYGADLGKLAREIDPASRKTAGTLNCIDVNLQGSGQRLETLGGTGKIELRNANIYEAPGMVRMLRELSIREIDPNAGAFSSADINFRLAGPLMYFNPIVFEGGLFSLQGDGMMRLDNRNIDLTMKTRLGNRRSQIPIISDIIGGAGDQIVQLKILGPLSDPAVTRVALPEIQKALQQLQTEVPPNPQPAPPSTAPGRLWNRPL